MEVRHFFDPATSTLTYVAWDPATRDAVVIDPVLDYDPAASRTSTASVEAVLRFVRDEALAVHWILETHPHADHLSGAQWLRRHTGAKVAIGERVREVQATFRPILGLTPDELAADGSQFDRLLADGETVHAGALAVHVIATPGHTPACCTYRIEDTIFTGDALFVHDYGTGRCDFPRGDAGALYDSIQTLYRLPDATRVCPAHDYQPGGRALVWHTTIGRSKAENIQLGATTTRADFVRFRSERDRTLSTPRLLYPSIRVNLDAGRLPAAGPDGRRYLRIPLDLDHPVDDDGSTPRQ
jgi:glyoxylase-like metal-dependent hydrolase (beta-lactamase superfamily II)